MHNKKLIFKDDKSAGIINFVLPFYLFSSTDESSSDEEKTTEKESAKDPQYDNPSQKDDSYRTGDYDDSQSRKDDSLSRTDNAHNDDDVTRTGRSYTIKEGSRDEEFTQVTKISATADVKNMSKVSMFVSHSSLKSVCMEVFGAYGNNLCDMVVSYAVLVAFYSHFPAMLVNIFLNKSSELIACSTKIMFERKMFNFFDMRKIGNIQNLKPDRIYKCFPELPKYRWKVLRRNTLICTNFTQLTLS